MFRHFSIMNLVMGLCLFAFPFTTLSAEKPAEREFNKLVQEINQTLNEARNKAKEINQRRQAERRVPSEEQLEARAKQQKVLGDALDEYRENETPESEAHLQKELVHMTRLSTDFLEGQKNDIITGLDLIDVLSDKFSTVIVKIDQLEKVTEQLGMSDTPKYRLAVEQAKTQMRSVLQITKSLDLPNTGNPELERIKATMDMYVGKLLHNRPQSVKLQDNLKEQRKNLEHVFVQLQLARERLDFQKTMVAQLTLGEIVDNMLMKASYLLLGNSNIGNFAEKVIEECNTKDDDLLEFQRQSMVTYGADNSVPGDSAKNDARRYSNLDALEKGK